MLQVSSYWWLYGVQMQRWRAKCSFGLQNLTKPATSFPQLVGFSDAIASMHPISSFSIGIVMTINSQSGFLGLFW